jgi:hypothetical protein
MISETNHLLSGARNDTVANISTQDVNRPAPESLSEFDGILLTGRPEPAESRPVKIVRSVIPDSSNVAGTSQSGHPATGGRMQGTAPGLSFSSGDQARTDTDLEVATKREAVVLAYRALTATIKDENGQVIRKGLSTRRAARAVGYPFHTIRNWCKLYDAGGFDKLLPKTANSGRRRTLVLTPEETAAVRANKLLNNLNKDGGSNTVSVLRTIEQGGLRPETAAALLQRESEGKEIVTKAIEDDLHIPEIFARSFRNSREEWLRFTSSPGSLMLTRDDITGETRLWQPGEAQTIDDATKNFVCTVPMERPGDKCWEKFKVVVGRWQILLHVDHRSYFILGFNHTARPKGSYRAEDLLASLHIGFKQHGRPKVIFLEKGISKASLLHHALDLAGVRYKHVHSPHQKVVEFVFSALWSRLSFLPGQVGRRRGEEGDVDALLESCKRGATDPRDYFLPLSTVLAELRKVCEEWNAHLVKSPQYGRWIPEEFFAAEAPKHMRELRPEQEWIFSPTVADNKGEGYLVRSQNIRTSFLVMPGYSWLFDFEAPWLQEYYGARVRLHFNAFEPECPATVVLQREFHGKRAGTVLGVLDQINWLTRHNRRLMGIEETEDIGLIRTRQNAQALRRNVFGIRPEGKPGVQAHEARNGLGEGEKVTNFPTPPATAPANPDRAARAKGRGVDEDEFERQAARLARFSEAE